MVKNFPIKVKCPKCGQMFIVTRTHCVYCNFPNPNFPLKDKILPKGESVEIDGRNII